ncbi:hypothetical protein FHU13_004967 [Methylobacterium sp. R2-1]|nr:hypothetical protein [Methylobacterium sp. R2-1]
MHAFQERAQESLLQEPQPKVAAYDDVAGILPCDVAAKLERWAKRKSPSKVAHQLGISMARVRDLRAGRLAGYSRDLLVELAARAGLKGDSAVCAAAYESSDVSQGETSGHV